MGRDLLGAWDGVNMFCTKTDLEGSGLWAEE